MALNAASHNPTGEKTGPISGQPPPVSSEITDDIMSSAENDLNGTNAPGQEDLDTSSNETKSGGHESDAKSKEKA
ncbi:hypothetical protein AAFC00_002705 [Neodothiora populina]|uniref:Uncharacterized protein n=1 Tax=Neodothiora populina TaxID=2781224 RepID=A0ABR3P893_9PEZI